MRQWYKVEELEDSEIESILEGLNETIQEWEDEGVYSGDRGYQDMLEERCALIEEQEERARKSEEE